MKRPFVYFLLLLGLILPGGSALAQTLLKQQLSFRLNGAVVTGKIRRNYATYPATAAGDTAVKRAVESGLLTVTLTSGSRYNEVIIAHVTRPPSTTAPTGVSWLSGVRYSLTGANLWTVQATGEAVQLRFDRGDNAAMSGTNPDGVSLQSGQYYPPAPGYPMKWQASFNPTVAGVSQRLSFKREATGQVIAYIVTPVAGATDVVISGGATGGGDSSPPASSTAPASPVGGGFLTYADQGWSPGNPVKYLENEFIKIGFDLNVGACVTEAFDKTSNPGRNLNNTPYYFSEVHNRNERENGRSWQFASDYFRPGHNYAVGGDNTNGNGRPHVYNTGANTVQGGSYQPYAANSEIVSSAIVNTTDRGNVFCARIKPKIWGHVNTTSHVTIDFEGWLVGRALAYKTRHIYADRPPGASPPEYESRAQENPCLFSLATMTEIIVKVNGTNQNINPGYWDGGATFTGTYFAEDCRIGNYEPNGGIGITHYSPINSSVLGGTNNSPNGDATSNAAAYIAADFQFNYDNTSSDARGHYVDYGYIVIGTKSQADAQIATLPAIDQSVDFDFTKDNHRWWNNDCRGVRESNGDYVIYIGDVHNDPVAGSSTTNGNFFSPPRSWVASSITQIRLTMAAYGVSTLRFKWNKTGKNEPGVNEYETTFSVIGDGVERTYTVNTSGLQNWNGRIAMFGIQGITNGGMQSNAKLVMKRIQKQP